ncbi:c-type cytochrome [Parasphingorhabdus sp.]|uniref:c-type cytochrome n=1 Tax=Parasphingorhabdus sp. TaxID=2709688 RepID=UPI002F9267E7
MKVTIPVLFLVGIAMASVTIPAAANGNASGNAKRGKVLFMQCAACHSVKASAPHKVGPNLAGIVGAKMGDQDKFRYSAAMAKAGAAGKKWTGKSLDSFIANPRGALPGNSMSFGGIPDKTKRQDIIAYLESL